MRGVLMVLATAVSMALLACGIAVADTVTANFEDPPFHLGSVAGQDGWTSAVPGDLIEVPQGYDQAVVANTGAPAAFQGQSLRHSNAFNEDVQPGDPPPEFFYQTYSRRTVDAAGESLPNTVYTAEISFTSSRPDRQQPGLFMSLSPDDGGGGRMSYIGLDDTPTGVDIWLVDTPDPDAAAADFFAWHYLATVSRDEVHTIKFRIKLNPGPDNDLLRVDIDGTDFGECFTTWENFYRGVGQDVPESRSLLFLSRGPHEDLSLAGGGYLFDNLTITTGTGPEPAGCDGGGDGGGGGDEGGGGDGGGGGEVPPDVIKTTRTRSARPGDLITYRITVRGRGTRTLRRLRLCDRAPRALRFVRSRARLRRAGGRRLCLTIPTLRPGQRKTFRATFRLRANVRAQTVRNGGEADIPAVPVPLPAAPASEPAQLPPEVAGAQARRRRVARDAATIRVRTAPPRVTG